MYLRELIEELIRYDIDYPDEVKVLIRVKVKRYDDYIGDWEDEIGNVDFIGGWVVLS